MLHATIFLATCLATLGKTCYTLQSVAPNLQWFVVVSFYSLQLFEKLCNRALQLVLHGAIFFVTCAEMARVARQLAAFNMSSLQLVLQQLHKVEFGSTFATIAWTVWKSLQAAARDSSVYHDFCNLQWVSFSNTARQVSRDITPCKTSLLCSWRSGYCYLNKGECNFNQSKEDSFVERVAKNNS